MFSGWIQVTIMAVFAVIGALAAGFSKRNRRTKAILALNIIVGFCLGIFVGYIIGSFFSALGQGTIITVFIPIAAFFTAFVLLIVISFLQTHTPERASSAYEESTGLQALTDEQKEKIRELKERKRRHQITEEQFRYEMNNIEKEREKTAAANSSSVSSELQKPSYDQFEAEKASFEKKDGTEIKEEAPKAANDFEAAPIYESLVLTSKGSSPDETAKIVQSITGLSLTEALSLISQTPVVLKEKLSPAQATAYQKQLKDAGAEAEIRLDL